MKVSTNALNNRLASSRSLLLLGVFFAATTLPQHAGATTCSDEFSLCYYAENSFGFTECAECSDAEELFPSEYEECTFNIAVDLAVDDPCTYYSEVACCLDLVSPNDCLGNEHFVAYEVCQIQNECGTAISCADGRGSGAVGVADENSGAGTSFPSAKFMPVLILAFITAAPFVDGVL